MALFPFPVSVYVLFVVNSKSRQAEETKDTENQKWTKCWVVSFPWLCFVEVFLKVSFPWLCFVEVLLKDAPSKEEKTGAAQVYVVDFDCPQKRKKSAHENFI